MNNTAKNVIRVAGVVAGLAAAAWALRDRLLPAPEVHEEPPPKFREPDTGAASEAADTEPILTDVKGIGPVTADKLTAAGIEDVQTLATADPAGLSDLIGTSETTAAKWIEAAKAIS